MKRHLLVLVVAGTAMVSACGGSTVTPVSADAPTQDGPAAAPGAESASDDVALCGDVIAWSDGVADVAGAFLNGGSRDVQFEIVARAGRDASVHAENASDPELRSALQVSATGLDAVSQLAGVSVASTTLARDVLAAGRPPLERCAVISARSDMAN